MRVLIVVALAALMAACAVAVNEPVPGPVKLDASRFRGHLEALSSDRFGGRAPASPGEILTLNYLTEAFQAAGLESGNGDSWYQEVPLVAVTAEEVTPLVIGDMEPMNYREEMVVWTKRLSEEAALQDSELVFVGYGIVAPEYEWNDYEGVDIQGKTAVMLVNDPGFATQDKDFFNGNAMTYYGRWTYKFEEAARQGAAGAIIIHETKAAGYPWEVVTGSWSGPQFDLVAEDGNFGRVAIEGWIRQDQAIKLFEAAGLDPAEMMGKASSPVFEAHSLGLHASVRVRNSLSESDSKNVVGRIEGAQYPEETILYMAHWDHLGTDPTLEGDQIFNGSVDNATGIAGLLELARVFGQGPQPARSVVFLAVTAEESGLLGSRYYAENPVYDLATTVAGFNLDGMNVYGPTEDVVVIGYGSSELEDYLAKVANAQGRKIVQEPTPEKGFFYRSDHFNFSKKGVPVLYAESGNRHREKGEAYGRRMAWEYTALRYHKVADEYDPEWDLRGAVEDLELVYDIGDELANSRDFPNWYEGTEFRGIRDESQAIRAGR